jgi:hypothetical protein
MHVISKRTQNSFLTFYEFLKEFYYIVKNFKSSIFW